MKTTIMSLLALLFTCSMIAQEQKRLAYSYLTTEFEKAIPETLDKSKLSSKEEKLFTKFMKSLNRSMIVNGERRLSEKLTAEGYQVMPLDAVSVMGNSALNLDGYPFIFFPKKTLKKHADKDVADYFLSASMSVAKPLTAVVGMKPTVTVSLKLFNKTGELVAKVAATHKTERKISNIGFAVNTKESFSKIDQEHARILYEKIEEILMLAIDDAVSQLVING